MTFSPKFRITNATANALTRIERVRGFLEAAKLSEDWVAQMQARALTLEAHYTTHIEGTQLTLEQSERLIGGEAVTGIDPNDKRELLNYRRAFDLVSDYLGSGEPIGEPITEGLIREIQKRLVDQVRGNSAKPGEYRTIQNHVVNSTTRQIVYTPPPAQEVRPLMKDFVIWLQREKDTHPVLAAGIAQFQLVHIHPFLDGNGRTARLLSTLYLYRTGYDFKRLFTISEYYDRDRPAYYRALQRVREQNMDLTGWLDYFAEGLSTQMREIQYRGEAVIKKDLILAKAHKLGFKDRPVSLLALLLERGKGTVAEFEQALKENRRTLQRDLKLLVDKGLVREIGSGPTDPTKYYEPSL